MVLVLGMAATGCRDDDGAYLTGTTKETNDCLRDGISVGPGTTDITLEFNHSPGELKVTSDADEWVKIATDPSLDDISTTVSIKILRNDNWSERKCTLSLSLLDKYVEIPVTQQAGVRVDAERQLYNVGRGGGDMTIKVRANTDNIKPVIKYKASREEWISYEGVEKTGDDEYTLRFHVKPNTKELGRICGIYFYDEVCGHNCCIWQDPRMFDAEERIDVESGTLDICLGTDQENIKRIKHLTLDGSINDIDWSALRQLCIYNSEGEKAPQNRMITLDLSNVRSYAGDESLFSEIGYAPKEVTCVSGGDRQIPAYVFEYATNIADIKLPTSTIAIQPYALSGCIGLTRIEIPNEVIAISTGAFKFSENLTEIVIGNYSMLRCLRQMAFSGLGPIKMLNLPEMLTDLEFGSLQCWVVDMKVGWMTPPELNPYPRVCENSTLFVPPGTVEAYRANKGWARFPNIVERDDMDEDGNILTPEW